MKGWIWPGNAGKSETREYQETETRTKNKTETTKKKHKKKKVDKKKENKKVKKSMKKERQEEETKEIDIKWRQEEDLPFRSFQCTVSVHVVIQHKPFFFLLIFPSFLHYFCVLS